MATLRFPVDQNAVPFPLVALDPTLCVTGTVAGTTARVALPTDDVVRVAASTDCYIRFGNSTVNAATSDALFVKGSELFKVPYGATHLAFIQLATGGVISVTGCV
jgi:hypothetical protein